MNNKLLILFICFLTTGLFVKAQQAKAIASRYKILIGEQLTVEVKISDINEQNYFIQNLDKIQDSSGHIQIIKTAPTDTLEVNGLTSYIQKIIVTSFDSGRWVLPPSKFVMQNRATGKQTFLQTDSLVIEVLSVNVSDLADYHAIKDIIEVEVKPNYFLYAAIAAGCIILAIITWLIIKKLRKKKPLPAKPLYKGTALQHALQQIKELQQENLIAAGKTKLFYTRLTTICRDYFQEQLQVRSPQATSDELMLLLGVYLQDEKKRTSFYQLLRLGDAVKFAKYIPAEEQNKQAVETAITSLQHIDALIQNIKKNA